MEQITQYVFGRSEHRDDVLFDANVTDVSTLDPGADDIIDGESSEPQQDAIDADAEINRDHEGLEASVVADVAMEADSLTKDLETDQELAVETVEGHDQDETLALDTEIEAKAEAKAEAEAEIKTEVDVDSEGVIERGSDMTVTKTNIDEQPPLDSDQKGDS